VGLLNSNQFLILNLKSEICNRTTLSREPIWADQESATFDACQSTATTSKESATPLIFTGLALESTGQNLTSAGEG
jgi:hypothetical protein